MYAIHQFTKKASGEESHGAPSCLNFLNRLTAGQKLLIDAAIVATLVALAAISHLGSSEISFLGGYINPVPVALFAAAISVLAVDAFANLAHEPICPSPVQVMPELPPVTYAQHMKNHSIERNNPNPFNPNNPFLTIPPDYSLFMTQYSNTYYPSAPSVTQNQFQQDQR